MFGKNRNRYFGTWRFRRGNAVLDAAFVMPLLLALALGTAEYGYFFFVKHSLQGAAREGCRRAIIQSATVSDYTSAVAAALKAAGLNSSNNTLDSKFTLTTKVNNATASPVGVAAGSTITVEVSVTWANVGVNMLPVAMGGVHPNKVVKGVTVMRKEG
jgi:Flp pilus assembly protein TadG